MNLVGFLPPILQGPLDFGLRHFVRPPAQVSWRGVGLYVGNRDLQHCRQRFGSGLELLAAVGPCYLRWLKAGVDCVAVSPLVRLVGYQSVFSFRNRTALLRPELLERAHPTVLVLTLAQVAILARLGRREALWRRVRPEQETRIVLLHQLWLAGRLPEGHRVIPRLQRGIEACDKALH